MRLIVGVTGASGIVLARRLLEVLKEKGVETHLIVSSGARDIIQYESPDIDLASLASVIHSNDNLAASISSGSFETDGMVIIPASMKTVGQVAHGIADNLIVRAADVCLKEERKLIVVPREAPLNLIHLRNLTTLKEAGVTIIPPVLAFYPKPQSIDDMVDFVVGKVLDSLNIEHNLYRKWSGKKDQD